MHIAIIPARKGSKGFPFKNRLFFDNTGDFLQKMGWFKEVVVSTDDEVIMDMAVHKGFKIHKRSKKLAGDAISIKMVMTEIVSDLNFGPDTILWLFYLPILYKNVVDFNKAKQIVDSGNVKSLCSFVKAHTHPFNCWMYDEKSKEMRQFIINDVFRRQDLPTAWMHYHYTCCFKASELDNLNSELINGQTYPFFLDNKTTDNLIEVDTPADYEKWKKLVYNSGEKSGIKKT